MKHHYNRIWLASAIGAALLAGCSSHDDSNVVKNDISTVKSTAPPSTPYNPANVDRSKIPSQFQEQFEAPSPAQSGAPAFTSRKQ